LSQNENPALSSKGTAIDSPNASVAIRFCLSTAAGLDTLAKSAGISSHSVNK
jgi:hypothetical protein